MKNIPLNKTTVLIIELVNTKCSTVVPVQFVSVHYVLYPIIHPVRWFFLEVLLLTIMLVFNLHKSCVISH